MNAPGRPTPPKRVRVTSPRGSARTARARSRHVDLAEETLVGEVYVESLLRAQRRLALSLLAGLSLLLATLPLVVRTNQDLGFGRFTVVAAWLGLGALVYPLAFWLTRWYIRHAERVEAEFVDLLERP